MTTIPAFSKMVRNRLSILSEHFPAMSGQECYELLQKELSCLEEIEAMWPNEDEVN